MNLGEKLIVAGVVFLPASSAAFWTVLILWYRPDVSGLAIFLAVASAAVAVTAGLVTSGILLLRRKRA
jgi:hypothetical protein